ncbi:hypothetical protein RB213_004787 [Colletotrichum asianum]|jgi:ankyrin repeat protein
MKSY